MKLFSKFLLYFICRRCKRKFYLLSGSHSNDYSSMSFAAKGISPCSQSPNSQNSSDVKPCYTLLQQSTPKSPLCSANSPSHDFAAHSPYYKQLGAYIYVITLTSLYSIPAWGRETGILCIITRHDL